MMMLKGEMNALCDATEKMKLYAQDAAVQAQFRAAIAVYRQQLEQNRALAQKFIQNEIEVNERIFQNCLTLFDAAAALGKVEIAESAAQMIHMMRSILPEKFNAYYRMRFGR